MSRSIIVRKNGVEINPEQFFHRIIFVCPTEEQKKEAFAYELAPQPPALFHQGIMRKTAKSTLAEVLQELCECEVTCPPNTKYVVDGGHLLHTVSSWHRGITYEDLCNQYVRYVVKLYGASCTVVFDGYRGPPSTKGQEQRRRVALRSSVNVDVRSPLLPAIFWRTRTTRPS